MVVAADSGWRAPSICCPLAPLQSAADASCITFSNGQTTRQLKVHDRLNKCFHPCQFSVDYWDHPTQLNTSSHSVHAVCAYVSQVSSSEIGGGFFVCVQPWNLSDNVKCNDDYEYVLSAFFLSLSACSQITLTWVRIYALDYTAVFLSRIFRCMRQVFIPQIPEVIFKKIWFVISYLIIFYVFFPLI